MTLDPGTSAVRDIYARLLDGWNRRSAEDMTALFAADGTLIGFDGSVPAGAEILEHLAAIFADHPTAAYVAKIERTRPVGSTGALLRAIVGMVPPGATALKPAANAHQTLVVDRRDNGWLIVLFQNTPAQYHGRPHLVEQHTAELHQLLARGER